MMIPVIIFGLLVTGSVLVGVLAFLGFRFVRETAVVISIAALLLWFLLRTQVPLTVQFSTWAWRVDEVAWQLSGWLLLLVTAVLLASRRGGEYASGRVGEWRGGGVLLLTAGGLMVVWADSLVGMMAGWMVLLVTWSAILLTDGQTDANAAQLLPRLGWLLLGFFFMWLGVANAPAGAKDSLMMGEWPRVASSSVLVAAHLQMGVWPFYGWRPTKRESAPETAVLLHIVPAFVGASLLVRLVATSDIGMGYSLFLTAFGLLGLLTGIRRAWTHLYSPAQAVAWLALAQTSLILLSGVWGGTEALLAETRVLALAVGVLFLMGDQPIRRARWQRVIAPIVALAAIAGLPLTAGFTGRAALYNGWLENGRFVLVLVSGLLHVPLVTAVAALILRTGQDDTSPSDTLNLPKVARIAAPLLLAAGLLSINGPALSTAKAITWLALLLPIIGGLALFRYMGTEHEMPAALHRAFSLNIPFDNPGKILQKSSQQVGAVLQEAAAILEGEGGVLWLLVMVIVFVLAR